MDYNTSPRERMILTAFLQIILLLQAMPVEASEYCQYGYTSSFHFYLSKYCEFGCCGSKYSHSSDVCCVKNLAGTIAGSVIGGLVGLGFLIGFIVCCCVAANNSGRRTGTVIQPANTLVVNNTAFAQGPSTNPGPYGPVGYGYPGGFPPPAYAQYNNMPTGGTNPAYPPPPAVKY